ncbi:BZ3500_MvSof-1268-A1-R1_Chr3-3g06406 [Microbotryum saponariae]|uniref:BZ3500_MvSof-1268-A1-R1_Chr3-3g06406 protein n=1 Tax=Microbotryum saponariae TaxID=289078 RepID=A0A2X0KV27_9BASI|nr:BZ3500_MvSof-1268-A1-R1_Chr3-3g06406 [Microbotryum saponariae]SDA04373.1 BZ3501_MvSof-1269-A2-R1_Chr3-2g06093 [Microbotryum saponariae]
MVDEYRDREDELESDSEAGTDVNDAENDSDSWSIASSRSSLIVFEESIEESMGDSDGDSITEEEDRHAHAAKVDQDFAKHVQDRERESQTIKNHFIKPRPEHDSRHVSWTGRLGSRRSVEEIVEAIRVATGGQSRLVACHNANRPCAECRFEPANEGPSLDETPDIVLLPLEVVNDKDSDFVGAWSRLREGEKDIRGWIHVTSVGIIHHSDSSRHARRAVPRLKRQLLRMLNTPIRDFALGFTLLGSALTIYTLTNQGLFYSPPIECTLENGNLSTFLFRLLDMSNVELGVRLSYNGSFSLEGLKKIPLD